MIKVKSVIDLSHPLNENSPTWTGKCGFHMKAMSNYDPALVMEYHFLCSSTGTHMDSPAHFLKGKKAIDELPVDMFIVPLHVIDVSKESHPDFFLQPSHIERYEQIHGPIQPKSFVVTATGWEKYAGDRDAYRPMSADRTWHYPGISKAAAEIFIKRDVSGIGIDTLNPDGSDPEYPVHYAILGAGKYIVENLRNLDQVPAAGAFASVLPIKVEGGPEAPVRAVAFTLE